MTASTDLPTAEGPGSASEAPELPKRAYEQLSFLFTMGIAYALEMGLRPQTLYGGADSPAALAAWMLDHDAKSYEDIAQAFEGNPVGGLTRDEVLSEVDEGNHFAAWQEPELFTTEVSAGLRSLR
jgi:hypothetical protein